MMSPSWKAIFQFTLCISLSVTNAAVAVTMKSQPTTVRVSEPSPQGGNWASRISGAGVVWYHNFDAAAEVNQFRWSGGYNGGQDPLAKGNDGNNVSWQSSGGAEGGGFLRLSYPAGAPHGGSYWWRPFNAFLAGGNGRTSNDPGANGTIALQTWKVSDGSGEVYNWGAISPNPGWYGSPTDQAARPTKYQGNDFYLQVRVRRAQTPGAPPDSAQYSYITGKNVWLTTTNNSYTAQELVTYGQSVGNNDRVGVQSLHNVYVGQNYGSISDNYQPNSTTLADNTDIGWRYSGGWDTLLYHVTPGTSGGTGTNRTRVEVWAQHDLVMYPGESGVYKKIWDVTYSQSYDSGTNSVGSPSLPGWNALILAVYHNGSTFPTSFNFDYDQVIFSKATIAAPTK